MVVGYIRVSTEEQTESGLGLEAQTHSLYNYAQKMGYKVTNIFKDEGLSGSLPISKRPELLKAINLLKKGDILLVAKRDRLSRDVAVLSLIETETKKKKAKIISAAGEGTEGDDSGSVLFRGMIDQFAQFERLRIGERTKEALQAKKRKKERVGHIPFGFELAENKINLIANKQEQKIIKKMQELQQEGCSIRNMVQCLNESNIVNRNNSPWTHSSVHRILQGIKKHKILLES